MVSHSKTGPDQGRTNDLKSSPSSHVAEDEAKYAFGRFNDVVTIAADWFWEMDQKLRFTYQSSRFEEITGIPANNVLGKNREEAFKGLIDDTEKWARLGASLTEHTDYSMIWAIKHPDGKTRVLHTRGKPVFNAEDNFIGYRGVGSDITDSIEIMQALEISELRFRDFAEVGADWFFELDEALKLSWLSDDWHRPSGLAASDLLGKDEKVIPVEWFESETKWQHHQECLDKKIPFSSEYRWVSTDGKVMHIQTTGKPVFDEEGGFVGYRCASTDITERKSAEQFTLARERRFRTVIENVTDIVSLADEQGNITFLNSSAERIFGFDKDSQLPVKVGMFSCEDDREAIAKAHQNAIKNPGMIFKQTYRGTHRDGSIRVIETTRQRIVNIESEDNLLVVIHSRDITEQFLTDRALQDSEQRLRDFAETGADWFWEQDEKFRFTYVSGALPDLELFSNNNLIGKTRHELSREFSFKSDNWQQLARIYKKRESFNNFEYQIKRQNSQTVVVRINGKPIYDERGRFLGYRGTGVDVTESFFLAKMVSYQATHDSLTGLVNRREFEHRMTRLIEKSQNSNFSHALCYIDLDQFKVINDTCGHEAGDALLVEITQILKLNTRKRDTVARLGGDEFGILLERSTIKQAFRLVEIIRETADQFRFHWNNQSFRVGTSMGLVPINRESGKFTEIMRNADAACYAAKDAGRNCIHVFDVYSTEVARRHEEMQEFADVNQAFDDGRFVLHYQLIKPLLDNERYSGLYYEVLIRMKDDAGNIISPNAFLPTAERYNLITRIDRWVFRNALEWMKRQPSDTRCSINISGMSLASDDFLNSVMSILLTSRINPARICFEITETAAISNIESAIIFIKQLREKGCQFSLDDFGSGLSSFGYLKTLPVDNIKIDGMFVRDMLDDNINYEIVKSINDIAHVMGKKTIAEFVESEETLDALKKMGVNYAQGFAIGRPQSDSDLEG